MKISVHKEQVMVQVKKQIIVMNNYKIQTNLYSLRHFQEH